MFKKEIWEVIPWLKIKWKPAPYWVVNEKAVRLNAWIIFIIWVIVFIYTIITRDLFYLSIILPVLFLDFFLKISVWPSYSFFSILSNYLVKNKEKEYVWAKQKRFAWAIWFIMSWLTMTLIFLFWICFLIPMLLCLWCLIFMFLEAFYWYCVWCTIYVFLRDKWYIKKEKYAPVCAWWVCELKK